MTEGTGPTHTPPPRKAKRDWCINGPNGAGVIKIENKETGMVFLTGGAKIKTLISNARSTLARGAHKNKQFQADFDKYGEKGFSVTVMQREKEAGTKQFQRLQQQCFREFANEALYNLKPGGACPIKNSQFKRGEAIALNLDGTVRATFRSDSEITAFLGNTSKANHHKYMNTPHVFRNYNDMRRYRLCTAEFLQKRKYKTKQWSKKTIVSGYDAIKPNGENKAFHGLAAACAFLGISYNLAYPKALAMKATKAHVMECPGGARIELAY